MRMETGAFALIAGLALPLAALPSASRAAIVETIIDTDADDAVVGSITFPTLTGSSDAGVLFSYDGYTQADITSISWTLDPTTYDVTALDLHALQGDNPCPNDHMDCSNSKLTLSPTSAVTSFSSCSFSGDIGSCETLGLEPGDIAFVPSSIPEPSTWAMMLVGFAGLGFAGWRAQRKTAELVV
jgi:hypothetical protein